LHSGEPRNGSHKREGKFKNNFGEGLAMKKKKKGKSRG